MSIHSMDDLYDAAIARLYTDVVARMPASDLAVYDGCRYVADVLDVVDADGQDDWLYDEWTLVLHDVMRPNRHAVWNALMQEIGEDSLLATAVEHGYEHLDEQDDELLYLLVDEYYVLDGDYSQMWFRDVTRDYAKMVLEVLSAN